MIQGTQQIYVAFLWYWGALQDHITSTGVSVASGIMSTPTATAVTTPIAVLMWAVGLSLYFGLPKFYRQTPGRVPSFYTALLRRKIVLVSHSLPRYFAYSCLQKFSGSLFMLYYKITGYRHPMAAIGNISGQAPTFQAGP